LLLDLRERMQRDGAERALADFDGQKLDEAWEALAWRRSLYARPLSTVAGNLRYHVDRADARVQGRIEVAQRLKRLETVIGKLGASAATSRRCRTSAAFAPCSRAFGTFTSSGVGC
jgi:hypothetical protein